MYPHIEYGLCRKCHDSLSSFELVNLKKKKYFGERRKLERRGNVKDRRKNNRREIDNSRLRNFSNRSFSFRNRKPFKNGNNLSLDKLYENCIKCKSDKFPHYKLGICRNCIKNDNNNIIKF